MSSTSIWIAIVLGGLGTYAIRVVFLALADRVAAVPPRLRVALRMIPAAALAALAIPPLLRPDGDVTFATPEFGAGSLALVVAWKTRSIPITLVAGLAAILGLNQVL